METYYVGQILSASKVQAGLSFASVRHVIALLDSAACLLGHMEHAAHGTLLEAASLLRKQLDSQVAEGNSDGRGRLLAWQARKVQDYIDGHITGPVPVSDLCALVRFSEAHFSRSFKRTFGESPHAFVIRRRLEVAAQYMLQTDVPLSDIALRCGFADQAHLSRLFRHASGLTPSGWRRISRTQDVSQIAWQTSRRQIGRLKEADCLSGATL
jgi:AraC family transcriptional regulator